MELTATVTDADQESGHNFRWSGATAGADRSKAVVNGDGDPAGDALAAALPKQKRARRRDHAAR